LPKPESRAPRHRAPSLPVFSLAIGNLGNDKRIANIANQLTALAILAIKNK